MVLHININKPYCSWEQQGLHAFGTLTIRKLGGKHPVRYIFLIQLAAIT